jgi:hypothetical protein
MKKVHCTKPISWLPVLFLMITAFVLRIIGSDTNSFHNDELSALYRLQVDGFYELIDKSITPDAHPALIQTFLYYWTKITGFRPWLVRLPFVIAGVASVWLILLLGMRWFGRNAGWLAATSFGLLQFPILYSQLSRPYSTGVFFILAATLCWNRLIRPLPGNRFRKSFLPATGMTIFFALAMYNHYFSFFMAGTIGITGLFLLKKNTLVPYLLSGGAAILLFMPHLLISTVQVARGGLALWLAPPNWHWISDHFRYLFNDSSSLLITVAVLTIPWLVTKAKSCQGGFNRLRLVSVLWFFIPLIFAFSWSWLVNPILQHSIMLFALPFLLLALFSSYGDDNSHFSKGVVVLYPLLLISHLLFSTNYYKTKHYTDFKEAAAAICDDLSIPGTVWATDVNDPWYIHFYLDQKCHNDSALFYSSGQAQQLVELQTILDTLAAERIVYARLRPADPLVPELIRQYYPIIEKYSDQGHFSEIFTFSRGPVQTGTPLLTSRDTIELQQVHIDSTKKDLTAEYIPLTEFFFKNIIQDKKYNPDLIRCVIEIEDGKLPEELFIVIEIKGARGQSKLWSGSQPGILHQVNRQYIKVARLPEQIDEADLVKVYIWNPELVKVPACSVIVQSTFKRNRIK